MSVPSLQDDSGRRLQRIILQCVLLITALDLVSGNAVTQAVPILTVEEGQTALDSYLLYWYRHDGETGPQFLIRRWEDNTESRADGLETRFSMEVKAGEELTTFKVEDSQLKDATIYYCAFRAKGELGYTTPLIFGGGTVLTVQPNTKPSEPSLSVFTPPKEGAPAACVATGFFPKDIDISMKVGAGAPEITASNDKAVLSLTDKTYNFAAFLTVDKGNNQEVTCEAKGQTVESSKNEQSADKPAPTASALNCERNGTSTDQKGMTIESIHLNFKSLTLQGLRVMFVKTVAFNFLMTVRALMF